MSKLVPGETSAAIEPIASESDDLEADSDLDGPEPEVIPREFADHWIVWSKDRSRIIGHGHSPADALNAAVEPIGPLMFVPQLGRMPVTGRESTSP